jgi:hypothetical protein
MRKFVIPANKSPCDWNLWRLIWVTFSGLTCSIARHKVEIVSGAYLRVGRMAMVNNQHAAQAYFKTSRRMANGYPTTIITAFKVVVHLCVILQEQIPKTNSLFSFSIHHSRDYQTALYRKSSLCITRNETARCRSQFLHSCIWVWFIYSQDQFAYLAAAK